MTTTFSPTEILKALPSGYEVSLRSQYLSYLTITDKNFKATTQAIDTLGGDPLEAVEVVLCAAYPEYWYLQFCFIYDSISKQWIPFRLWPFQQRFVRLIHEHGMVAGLKARQVGFTWIAGEYALWASAFDPVGTALVYSRREREAVDIIGEERVRGTWKRLPDWMIDRTGLELRRERDTYLLFENGSSIRAFAPGGGDSYTATYALVDEADLVPDLKSMVDSIIPAVEAGGKLVLVGRSDEKRNNTHFKKIMRSSDGMGFKRYFVPWMARPGRNAAWYAQKRREYADDDDMQKQFPATVGEALSRSVKGKIYPDFDPANITDRAEYDPAYPIHWFVDDGYTNPRVILFYQERPVAGYTGERFVIFAEYVESQRTSDQTLTEVLGWSGDPIKGAPYPPRDAYTQYPRPETVYHDPSAAEFAGACQGRGLSTWGAYNDVSQGIKVVRKCVLDANGERRLLIHPRCIVLKEQMEDYREADTGTPDKGGDMKPVKEDDHGPDALRYGLATRYLHLI